MQFEIEQPILDTFPEVKIGILLGTGLNNQQGHPEIATLMRTEEEAVRKRFSIETLAMQPKINDWREAYRTFGFKPSTYKNSVEALTRRVLKGKELPSINSIVDLYNLISIKHTLPAGADDLAHIDGKICLTKAQGGERFIQLGSGKAEEIQPGEVIYRDETEVLCRCWNYRECDKSKITPKTTHVCLVIEGLAHTTEEEIQQALIELEKHLQLYCGGSYRSFVLTRDHNTGEIQ